MIHSEKVDLNIKFNGSYYLFRWILKKYKNDLPYNGQIKQFAIQNNYGAGVCDQWRNYGVGNRVWNLLHKDLTILYLTNKIQVANLFELQKLHEAWKKDDTISINNYYDKAKSPIEPPPIKFPPIPTDTRCL
jgi:hypothetical protein